MDVIVSEAYKGKDVQITSIAPRIFENCRRINQVHISEVLSLFSISNLNDGKLIVRNQINNFYIIPWAGNYFLSSISQIEYENLNKMLPDYYMYLLMNPNSFLMPIYGCYALECKNAQPQYFILCGKILNQNESAKREIYCLEINEMNSDVDPFCEHKILTKESFEQFGKMEIPQNVSAKVIQQLDLDSKFLMEHGIANYSFFLYLLITPSHIKKGAAEECQSFIELQENSSEFTYLYRITNKNDIKKIKTSEKEKESVIINFDMETRRRSSVENMEDFQEKQSEENLAYKLQSKSICELKEINGLGEVKLH